MVLAAVVCPHPPLLVPEVAAGAAHETEDLRHACRAAVSTLPDDTLIVGTQQAVEIGTWLLPNAPSHVLPPGLSPEHAAAVGRDLGAAGLLVMGDGSARRTTSAPGYFDPRAEPYDDAVARALRDADAAALLALDPALDAELLVAGRAAWQVLAGAAGGGSWSGELLYDAAPYGVGYFVATWTRA